MPRFLLGLSGGLYCFDAQLDGNEPALVLRGVEPMALATDPNALSRVYCATYNRGLWRSEDRGDTWYPIGTPQSHFRSPAAGAIPTFMTTFVSVVADVSKPGRSVVWVGTDPSRLYKSYDGGNTFELVTDFATLCSRPTWSFPLRPGTHHVRWMAYGSNDEVYVSIEYGAMLRSLDGGRTFEDRRQGSPLDTHVLRTHPAAPSRLYAATGDGLMQAEHSWAESRDGGTTWQYASKGLETMPYLYGLAVNLGDPNDIRIAASPSVSAAHENGPSSIYRNVQGSWVEDGAGFPRAHSRIPVLAADSERAGRWYALSNLGLFQKASDDQAWQIVTALPAWRDSHPMCFAQLQ